MSDKPAIKPCIFCGSEKVEIRPHAGCIRCNNCGANGPQVMHTNPGYLAEIIEKWNIAHRHTANAEKMEIALTEYTRIFIAMWVRLGPSLEYYRAAGEIKETFVGDRDVIDVLELLIRDANKYHAMKSKYAATIPSIFED